MSATPAPQAEEVSVKSIVLDYLKAHGFDGLWNDFSECACGLDDLSPCCDGFRDDCRPGYYQYHTPEGAKAHTGEEPYCESEADGSPCGCIGQNKVPKP